jgi:hypothetical protein
MEMPRARGDRRQGLKTKIQRNDPTIIIYAQESRAFESKSLTPE